MLNFFFFPQIQIHQPPQLLFFSHSERPLISIFVLRRCAGPFIIIIIITSRRPGWRHTYARQKTTPTPEKTGASYNTAKMKIYRSRRLYAIAYRSRPTPSGAAALPYVMSARGENRSAAVNGVARLANVALLAGARRPRRDHFIHTGGGTATAPEVVVVNSENDFEAIRFLFYYFSYTLFSRTKNQ